MALKFSCVQLLNLQKVPGFKTLAEHITTKDEFAKLLLFLKFYSFLRYSKFKFE